MVNRPRAQSIGLVGRCTTGLAAVVPFVSGKVLRDVAEGASSSLDDLIAEARKVYPNKAGKIEQHHITPKYMGGDPRGPLAPLDASYHQVITNEFRALHPFGAQPPSADEVQQIMEQVYTLFPLPPG